MVIDSGISPDLADSYARDGVALVRGVLSPEEVELARTGIERVLAHPGPLALVASGPDDPGRFVEDFRRWQDVPEIEALALRSRVGRIAAALMRAAAGSAGTPDSSPGDPTDDAATGPVRFFHDHVLVKEGHTHQRTPWHQDQPYYNVDGMGISAWIPVDPVPEAGCLELVAATHRGPWLMPRTFLTGEARWFPEGSLAELPDIDADRAAFDIRRFDLAPGDAIFFDFLTVHGAPGFPFAGRRRVLSLRYLSPASRHAPRRWRTSPPLEGLDAELATGAELDHPLFPVVEPAEPARPDRLP